MITKHNLACFGLATLHLGIAFAIFTIVFIAPHYLETVLEGI
ncbi:hypothetical protein [Neptuniibacter sp. QD37_11]